MNARVSAVWAVAALAVVATGCILAVAGAGAGGGIYFTQRGAEGVVPASIKRAASATNRAFRDLKIKQTNVEEARGDQGEKREVSGKGRGQTVDVTVTLNAETSGSTRVQVVARKSAVTWDKEFARRVLEKIVAYSR
jgi:hypothetical protein